MALIKCKPKKWRKVENANIHINTTNGEHTYTFPKTIRNITFNFKIKGSWNKRSGSQGNDVNVQIGFTAFRNGIESFIAYNNFYFESGYANSGSMTANKTITYKDNKEYSKITTSPWCAAFSGDREYNTSVDTCDIWITSYEELI